MAKESDEDGLITRRSILTHTGAGVFGWMLGSFLDPFRRAVNEVIADTPFGRKAKVGFGYAEDPAAKGKGYVVQIANGGEETAENVSVHLGFEEQITDFVVEDWINAPPAPDMNIEVTDGGVARIDIDVVRREFREHFKPIQIHFSVEEGTESNVAFRIDDDEVMFVAYRYSWTFLGERYYESTEHHIASKN